MSKKTGSPAGCNRWELSLTLTFDIEPGDMEVRHAGDTSVDFANRALARVRPSLNKIVTSPGKPFKHFQLKGLPTPVVEYD